ncbi:hypothetical protein T484DRAFT_1853665 [Baffinella frigidus]|nr:hypothetical protein T484DRAFT_1853665 [Cryptophyta sp. CCMP2293]
MRPVLLLLVASLSLAGAFSFAPTLSALKPAGIGARICARTPITAQGRSSSPSIAKPKTFVGNQVYTASPQTAGAQPKVGPPKLDKKAKSQEDETPMFKVILLGDNDYEQAHVVVQITKTIPSVQKEEALKNFVEAQMTGSSVIIVVTEEHAEHYAQQLKYPLHPQPSSLIP